MKKVKQPGFFDIACRTDKLTEMGDPLVGLNAKIDWEAFRPDLNRIYEKERKSKAGAKPIDVVLMFKVLVLQQLNNLSDERIEYQIRDRLSFMRFLGLELEDRVPDAKTVWSFRNADQEHKLIQSYAVTDAAVHDSQVFDELLDHTLDEEGSKRAVYADSAYRSKATEEKLSKDGITSQICEKGTHAAALTGEQKDANKKKSKVRARVEHVFGAQNAMGGHFVRTIGLLRAQVKIGMMNLVYNMIRLVQLFKRDARMTG